MIDDGPGEARGGPERLPLLARWCAMASIPPAVRYLGAVAIVLVMTVARIALDPWLGRSAPLLPLVPAVLLSAALFGRGPGLIACALAPALLTLHLVNHGALVDPIAWGAHVGLFILLTGFVTLLITALQQAHRTQAIAAQALHESELRLRLIYNNSSDGLALLEVLPDERLRIVSVNATLLRMSIRAMPDLEGRFVDEVLPAALHAPLVERCREALASRRVVAYQEATELALTPRFAEVRLVPIDSGERRVRHLLCAVTDVTHTRTAEDRLREEARRKDEFLAMLAHELRNPLAPIRNIAHMLATRPMAPERLRESAAILQRQTAHLARMVEDLIDVSRITRGAIRLQCERLSLDAVVAAAVEMLEPTMRSKRQTVHVQWIVTTNQVMGDRARLTQVFVNLLENASKYSPEGAAIEVALEEDATNAIVRVSDAGIGIDAQMLREIFEVFVQADRTLDRRDSGLGVGLTIVQRLVGLHGGEIEAKSEGSGLGSEFIVRLPLLLSVASLPLPSALAKLAGARVLIVDDNVDVARTFATILEEENYDVRVVHDGAAALALIESLDPHVILLDIGLPDVDGFVVAQSIRQRFPRRATRIIAVSGYGAPRDRALSRSSGIDLHLGKPVEPAHLLRVVAEAIAQASPVAAVGGL